MNEDITEWKAIVDRLVASADGVTSEAAGKIICKLHNRAEAERKRLMKELDLMNHKERHLASMIWSSDRGY